MLHIILHEIYTLISPQITLIREIWGVFRNAFGRGSEPSMSNIRIAFRLSIIPHMQNYFSIPLFFILFRETIEAAVIISVLIAFIDRISVSLPDASVPKKLTKIVYLGVAAGLISTFFVGAIVISVWYLYGKNLWEENERTV